jgi:Glycosyltransferase
MNSNLTSAVASLPLSTASIGSTEIASAPTGPLVAHFVPSWPQNPYQAELARHLAAHGISVSPESRLKKILRGARRTARIPAIIHLHALPPFSWQPRRLLRLLAFVLRLVQLRRAGARLVWTVHNACDHESAHPRIDRFLARTAYHAVDAAILHSPGARSLAEQQWRTRRTRNVFVIHHGHFIDCYRAPTSRALARQRLGLPLESLVFLFLGNIRPYKGVPRLIRDFKAVAGPHLRLVIAGDVLSSDLQTEITREIGGSPLVDFRPGFIPDSDLADYLSASNAVVFPYTKALTSGALILAMSYGRACIAPAIGALADTLSPRGGYLYDPDAPSALRDALSSAIRASHKLDAMGAHNLQCARRWGWDEAARQTAVVYRTVLQPGT